LGETYFSTCFASTKMPRGSGAGGRALHPTIAVITAHYFEKVAVDAVMSNKQTFVRYATVGKTVTIYWPDVLIIFAPFYVTFLFCLSLILFFVCFF